MITSTFLPAAAPPLPPPPLLDDPPDARPATTPTTTAISAITATSDSENLTRLPVMTLDPLLGLRERFLNSSATVRPLSRYVKEYVFLRSLVWWRSAHEY